MNIAELRTTLNVLENKFKDLDVTELELVFQSGYSLTNIEFSHTISEDGVTDVRLTLRGDKSNG